MSQCVPIQCLSLRPTNSLGDAGAPGRHGWLCCACCPPWPDVQGRRNRWHRSPIPVPPNPTCKPPKKRASTRATRNDHRAQRLRASTSQPMQRRPTYPRARCRGRNRPLCRSTGRIDRPPSSARANGSWSKRRGSAMRGTSMPRSRAFAAAVDRRDHTGPRGIHVTIDGVAAAWRNGVAADCRDWRACAVLRHPRRLAPRIRSLSVPPP